MRSDRLAQLTQGVWYDLDQPVELSQVTTDSRQVKPGDVFVALQTDRADGHDYLASAFQQGAIAALVKKPLPGKPCLVVEDPLKALQIWAKDKRDQFNGTVIGVVGSVGKTSAKELLRFLLANQVKVHASPKSFNNHIGVPLTLASLPDDVDYLVVEMGSSGPGDLDFLGSLVRPDHLLVTPIGEAHLQGFGNLAGVRRAKGEILKHLNPEGWLIWPYDPELQKAWQWPGRQLTWGHTAAQISPGDTQIQFPHTLIDLEGMSLKLSFPALWAGALLAAIKALLDQLSIKPDWESLERFENSPSRLQIFEINGLTIVNDAWNANPLSVTHGLEMMASNWSQRRVFVLGDMLELGKDSLYWHHEIGRRCQNCIDLLICVGPQAKYAADTFEGPSHVYNDPDLCLHHLPALLESGDVVLFKGSRALALDKLANRLVPQRESA